MDNKIRKRSGHRVTFDINKIYKAIDSAFESCGRKCPATFRTIINQNQNKFKALGTVERIQDELENLLLTCGYIDIYKHFTTYRAERAEQRERLKRKDLMSIVNVEVNDITTDNANMAAQTPAGMMMKFAGELSKPFANQELIAPEFVKASDDNYIYIHDKDYFPTKSMTCLSEDSYITIRDEKGEVHHTQIKYLDKFLDGYVDGSGMVPLNANMWIQGRNGWTKITAVSRRDLAPGEPLYSFNTHKGLPLKVTGNHQVPVIRDGQEVLLLAEDIKVGDKLIKPTSFNADMIAGEYIDVINEVLNSDSTDSIVIKNIHKLRKYLRYKYDIENLYKEMVDRNWLEQPRSTKKDQKTLKYLTVGEFVNITNNYPIPNEVVLTLTVSTKCGKAKLPLYLPVTEDLATVAGFLHSEGSVTFCTDTRQPKSSYICSFVNKDEDMVAKYKRAWDRSIGTPLGDHVNEQGCHIVTASSKLLCILFSNVFGRKDHAYDIEVPDFIFNASDDIKWAYISALIDGDGWISKKHADIRYSTICKKFAEHLVRLFGTLGVECALNESFTEGRTTYFGDKKSRSTGNMFTVAITDSNYTNKVWENLTSIKKSRNNASWAVKQSRAVFCEPTKIKSITKPDVNGKVYDIETTEHWFVANDCIVHNCVQTPLDKLLKGGLFAGHGEIRPAKRIETAVVVAVISLQTTQNEMHGGQAIPAFDFYMAPYVHLTYLEEVEKLGETLEWTPEQLEYYKGLDIKEYTEEGQVDKYARIAVKRTINRTHQAMESFIHNCNNIHSRGGNQVVFSSINYGTDTSPEGRLVIRELLNCTLDGVGNGATAIFPIHVFKCKAGVNKNPGDPNYDLYKLSWPVTARRFFPNYLNLDASFNRDPNWKADDPKRYEHEVATMGALAGVEHLYVKIDGGEPVDISIKDFFEYCKTGELKGARPCQMWFNEDVSYNPVVRKELTYTDVRGDSGVYSITYTPEDITYIGSTGNLRRRLREHRCNINRYGKIDGGMVTGDNNLDNYKFEVLEYTDDYKNVEKKYIETIPNSNVRGTSNKYYRLNNVKNLIETRPDLPGDRKTPQDLIDLRSRDIKVYDRDGKWTKVLHVFKNDAKNTPQMMHIFYSEHDKEYCLRCTEDHPLWNGHTYKPASTLEVGEHLYRADGLELTITRIGWLTTRADSYDIGTATGTFIGSDIIMHNCRTRTYSNRFGQPTSIGRGNLSFTSINLPKLAIEVAIETGFYVPTEGGYKINPDCKVPLATRIKMFKSRLRSTADLVAKQLDDRYKFQKQALKNQFPLLMSGVWLDSEKLKSGQTVESVIKHGTLGVSFIGLAETLIMLTGKHHGESDESQAVGLDIISYLSGLCDGYSDEYDHNYSCFATPAEGLSGRFVVVDRKEYGNIEHVTDKDYYTNSSHVPVWYQCTPQHKAEIEGPYHKYEPGGHIFYVEADADITKNPEYVDAINRMAWANDCGYSSINHTQGRCEDCNFESNDPDLHRFGSTCPHCGGHWSTLDRVTGYLSSTYNKQAFGKKAEILDRVVHTH